MAITLNDEKLTGLILASMSNIIPEGFLLCDGSAINRNTYSSLFALSPSTTSIITMTIASPCVVTWSNHGLATGQSIQFSTTGALPTFSTVQTVYFVRVINTNTFNLYDTLSNAMNTGATTGRINTTGTQSGTHTGLVYYWGNGNGTTTFNIPDTQGAFLRSAGTSTGYTQNVTVLLGTKTNDQFQSHYHSFLFTGVASSAVAGGGLGALDGGGGSNTQILMPATQPGFGTPRTGTETTPKYIGVNYFIKF